MLKLVSFSDEHPSRFRWDSFPPPPVPKNEINLFPPLSRAANSQTKSTSNYRQDKICLFCLSEYLISTVGLLSLPLHHYVFSLWPGESDGPKKWPLSHCTPSVAEFAAQLSHADLSYIHVLPYIIFKTPPHSSGKKFSKTKVRSLSFLTKGTAPSLSCITWRFSNSFLL